jgi:hypothetical protein
VLRADPFCRGACPQGLSTNDDAHIRAALRGER